MELLVLFSLRFQIRAVESPDLKKTKQTPRKGMMGEMAHEALKLVKLCLLWRNIYQLFSKKGKFYCLILEGSNTKATVVSTLK